MPNNNFQFKDYARGLKSALDLVDQEQIDNFFDIFDSYIGSDSNIYLLG